MADVLIPATDVLRDHLVDVERASIRGFLERHQRHLRGRVLDYGCGLPERCFRPQPYRDLVDGEYVGYDVTGYPEPHGRFDTVLCTQVLQYVPEPRLLLARFRGLANRLVLTYPTHWAEVEAADNWRFTRAGMDRLLTASGWHTESHEERWAVQLGDVRWTGGYGVVAS